MYIGVLMLVSECGFTIAPLCGILLMSQLWGAIIPPDKSVLLNYFVYFSTKTYVVSTQKNRLDETVLFSTQNKCLNWWIRK